eukprot:TRINITY_DN319_c0_g1_i3.p1 TRINITY_DN319_c0_g1~~TRINITY_DN319_c0_g1_i3.p1  ORF type:complete len:167 (-),score=31.87 TRINITY_DN319_c0_g1_i3:162-662(-)
MSWDGVGLFYFLVFDVDTGVNDLWTVEYDSKTCTLSGVETNLGTYSLNAWMDGLAITDTGKMWSLNDNTLYSLDNPPEYKRIGYTAGTDGEISLDYVSGTLYMLCGMYNGHEIMTINTHSGEGSSYGTIFTGTTVGLSLHVSEAGLAACCLPLLWCALVLLTLLTS